MKKIIYILTLLSALLIFNTIFAETSSNQYMKTFNLMDGIAEERDQQVLNMTYDLGTNSSERMERFEYLMDFIYQREYTTMIAHGEQGANYKYLEVRYIYANENLQQLSFFNTLKNQKIDFSKPTDKYISGDYVDMNAYDHIAYIDKDYGKASIESIEYKQFSSYQHDIDFKENQGIKLEIALYFITDDKAEVLSEIESNKIGNYFGDSVKDLTADEPIALPSIDITFSITVVILTIMATIILFICQIFKSKKEILIRKMLGQGNLYISKHIFLKQIILCAFLYFFIQLIAYLLLIGNLNSVNYPFIQILLKVYLIYLSFLMITAVLTYLTVYQCKTYTAMKKRGDIGVAAYGSILLKMLFVILVIAPFIDHLFQSVDVIKETYTLGKNEEYMNDYITIHGITSSDIGQVEALLLDYFNENGGIYQDFGKNFENKSIIENGYASIEKLLYPYIIVNHAYLKDYSIESVEGDNLNTDKISGSTLLVPKKYRGKDVSQYCDTNCDTIYIKNGYNFTNHNALAYDNYTMLSKKDPIILIVDNIPNWNNTVLFYNETKENSDKLKEFIRENKLENSVTLNNTSLAYTIAINQNRAMLTKVLIILFLYLTLTLVFQFQSIYIYYSQHKNEFAVNYLLGKNFMQRYASILSLNVLAYVIPFIYGVAVLHIPFVQLAAFVMIAITIDIIVTFIMVRYLEKHRLIKVLKGDN